MIGLFFGTFDPIHVGHLIVAEYMLHNTELEEVWFMVSPQNPEKTPNKISNQYERLHMVHLAIEGIAGFKASNFEFNLPTPSYTHDTLRALKKKYPNKDFSIIVGSDSLINMHRWKNGEAILENETLLVYPRPRCYPQPHHYDKKNIHLTDAPLIDISSTAIRNSIQIGKPLTQMLNKNVWDYIDKQLFYS
jgi:nicotinate-nucleotide adenylyltransferase